MKHGEHSKIDLNNKIKTKVDVLNKNKQQHGASVKAAPCPTQHPAVAKKTLNQSMQATNEK